MKQAVADAKAQKKKIYSSEKKEAISGYLFILPWLLGLLIFTLFPMIFSMYLSTTKWDIISGLKSAKFVGLDNYKEIFTNDPKFPVALKVTFKYAIMGLPLQQIGALLLALLLNMKLKGMRVFRTIFFLPSILPAVAVSLLWMWIFNPDFGVLNNFLAKVGIQGPAWLQNPKWALPSLVIMSLWGIGGGMIIYLAGLQGVPTSLYEAAEIDGAGIWHKFRYVTLPMLSPTIFFNLVMGTIGTFQYFTQAFVMTNGGPLDSTLFYNLYLYNVAFKEFKMGYAAALAWVMFVIIMVFTLIIVRSSSAWVYYEGELKKS